MFKFTSNVKSKQDIKAYEYLIKNEFFHSMSTSLRPPCVPSIPPFMIRIWVDSVKEKKKQHTRSGYANDPRKIFFFRICTSLREKCWLCDLPRVFHPLSIRIPLFQC